MLSAHSAEYVAVIEEGDIFHWQHYAEYRREWWDAQVREIEEEKEAARARHRANIGNVRAPIFDPGPERTMPERLADELEGIGGPVIRYTIGEMMAERSYDIGRGGQYDEELEALQAELETAPEESGYDHLLQYRRGRREVEEAIEERIDTLAAVVCDWCWEPID